MNKALLGCLCLFVYTQVAALTVNLQVQNETCTYANGSVFAAVSGGVPPYAYLWGGGETTDGLVDLSAGMYSVTVTDSEGTQSTEQATVLSENYGDIFYNYPHSYCPGQNYREFFFPPGQPDLDVSPWSSSLGIIAEVPPPTAPGNYYLDPGPIPPGSGQLVSFWDVNGCSGTLSFTAGYPLTSWPTFNVVDVQGSCTNFPSGKVTFTSSPDVNVDTYYVLRPEGGTDFDYVTSFQIIGPDLFAFYSLPPGNYWLKNRLGMTYSFLQGGTCSSDSVLVTIPNYGTTCGNIAGSTYMDYNGDCIDTEADAMNVVVEIQPGDIYTTSNGSYSVVVPNGSYTLSTNGAAIAQSCPASATVTGNNAYANIGHQPTIPLDVAISLNSGPARPGFELQYYMHLENLSSSSSGATTTTFTFDPTITFIAATPTPSAVGAGTITWNQPALSLFQDRDFHIRMQVPPDVGLIGTELLASATVTTADTDGDPANNTATAAITVTGSYDPNDKTAHTSSRASDALFLIDHDVWVDYVIRFQNTGTDTAFNIIVTDTLPATLDPATITLVSASHAHSWLVQGQGTLKFIFPNILLPDSNVNESASHGLISFRIRPRQPVVAGTAITNVANIYFDFNPPVITEPSVLVAEFSTGVSTYSSEAMLVSPNPSSNGFHVALSGQRAAQLSLRDLNGRVVRVVSVQNERIWMDTAGLASGTYIVEAISSAGNNFRSVVHIINP